MKRNWTLPLIGLLILAVLGAGVALAVTQPWNRSDQGPTTASTLPPTQPSSPRETEPTTTEREQIALEAARIMTTWTPEKDLNRTAAELRARELMTAERAAAVTAPQRPSAGTEWLDAAARGARSVPTVELNHATEHSQTGVSVTATWTWDSPDGSDIPAESGTQPRIYYFEFTEENEIHDYSY